MSPYSLKSNPSLPYAPSPARMDSSTPPTSTEYRGQEIAPPPPGYGFKPTAINDYGQIVGNRIDPLRFEGASWTARGQMLPELSISDDDRPPTAERTLPYAALSSNGLIAGTTGESASRGGAWASHLGAFGRTFWPDNLSFGQDVNAAGTVVGKVLLTANPVLVARAFLVRPGEQPQHFLPPDGGLPDAVAINDEGAVLLNVTPLATKASTTRAWLWHAHDYMPLEIPACSVSTACDLNRNHQVVGFVEDEFGLRRPTLWTDGRPQDLETTMAEDFVPTCLNDELIIGGSALNRHAQRAACIWSPNQGLTFLANRVENAPSAPFEKVSGLNNVGQILADLTQANQPRGFLLSPSC